MEGDPLLHDLSDSDVSYSSAEASELPASTTMLDPFHPRSCPLPLGRSVTEATISTGVNSDRTDPTVTNSARAKKSFYSWEARICKTFFPQPTIKVWKRICFTTFLIPIWSWLIFCSWGAYPLPTRFPSSTHPPLPHRIRGTARRPTRSAWWTGW